MDIPAVYLTFRGGEIRSAPVAFEDSKMSFESEPVRMELSTKGSDERMPFVAVDVCGINKRSLDDRLLKNIKIPGGDVWYATAITDVEDIFDCFIGNISKVLMPYHLLRNPSVMKEAFELSDNCSPLIFLSKGRALCGKGILKELRKVLNEVSAVGFADIVLYDTDSAMTGEDWMSIHDRFPGAIPFVRSEDTMPSEFRNVIHDLRY